MNTQPRQTTKGIGIASLAATGLALGGLSLSAVAAAPAGAATGRLAKSVVVKTVNVANVGTVLASGKTLYTLKPSSTPCTAACLKIWPELVLPKGVKKATAGSGVSGSKLGTVTRAHGVRQVTFGGKPLYWFSNDTGPGQVNGDITDTWGKWTAVVTAKAKSSGNTTSTAGSGGTASSGRAFDKDIDMVIALQPPAATAVRAPRDAATRAQRRTLSSRVYLPACVIAAVAAALVALGWADRWGGNDFAASMTSLRVVVVGPLTLAIIGVFLIAERLRPAQRRPIFARGYRQDLLFTVFNATLVVPLVTALTLSFSEVAQRAFPWLVLPRIGTVPRWGAIALIFVAMDACNWFAHMANHRVKMLWRFHELHHSQEDMNVLTVFRTHPLIHVSYLVALIPGIVLLANGALPITLLVIYGGVVAFAHSNTNLGFGPLGRIFVSPNYHRQHHKLDGPQDVNLGFALTIWDQLFHRAVFPTPETIRTDTGLPGRPLVVEQAGARPHHFSVFAAQLVAPFRPMDGDLDLRATGVRSLRSPAPPARRDGATSPI